ncbi:hypothetical protein ACFOLD_11950 [Kocuria carniphila]
MSHFIRSYCVVDPVTLQYGRIKWLRGGWSRVPNFATRLSSADQPVT